MSGILIKEKGTVLKYGTYEITMFVRGSFGNPYLDFELGVKFTRPDGSEAVVDGFYDGERAFKARAYCDMEGMWTWSSISDHPELNGKSGSFEVVPSLLKGKLKIHKEDPHQFQYDNGDWFLHIGDTGYRYVCDTEPYWKAYIDQAVISGITKIRVWFCQDRSNVQALFQHDRKYLNLSYWQEADRRLVYALENYPEVNIQLILFAEDVEEVIRYAREDVISRFFIRYAQARFSSFANISWCISNDLRLLEDSADYIERDGQEVIQKQELISGIDTAGRELKAREPWGTLITNHQSRFSGYLFLEAGWSDIITIEDMGQVTGEKILGYRAKGVKPVVLDEDRYEWWRNPKHDRYFFRRLMWASLLSGGHATYGGLNTYVQFDGGLNGMYGYYDACREGKLECGAHDFIYIHKFFKETGITLSGMIPEDTLAGDRPLQYKVMRDKQKNIYIVYLANPDIYEGHSPDGFAGYYTDEHAREGENQPEVKLELPSDGLFNIKWFNPSKGYWISGGNIQGGLCTFKGPESGDWILLLEK